MRAGSNPVLVSKPYGKGNVFLLALTPLDDESNLVNQNPWWKWSQWPLVMQAILQAM
jgi:hypothetical protein